MEDCLPVFAFSLRFLFGLDEILECRTMLHSLLGSSLQPVSFIVVWRLFILKVITEKY